MNPYFELRTFDCLHGLRISRSRRRTKHPVHAFPLRFALVRSVGPCVAQLNALDVFSRDSGYGERGGERRREVCSSGFYGSVSKCEQIVREGDMR